MTLHELKITNWTRFAAALNMGPISGGFRGYQLNRNIACKGMVLFNIFALADGFPQVREKKRVDMFDIH